MKLIVHELKAAGLIQEIKAPRNVLVEAIRPHIYRHNSPTGSLKIQILDDSDVLITESEVIDIDDIGSQDFFHGYVRFLINVGLKEGLTYKIKLVGLSGYTFSESSYIGWCNDFDLSKYLASYNPATPLNRPLDIEIWERKNI